MTEIDLSVILDRLREGVVVCVGDAMLDCYVEGTVERISAEAPIPILSIKRERYALGGAANVARNLSALGAECRLVCAVGSDPAAKTFLAQLAELPNIDADSIALSDRPTTLKTRFVSGQYQIMRADQEIVGPLTDADAEALMDRALHALDGANALVISDYGKGVFFGDTARLLIAKAKDLGIPVIVDPKTRFLDRYKGADFIKPNRDELSYASDLPARTEEEIVTACRAVTANHEIGAVLASRSEDGLTLFRRATTSSPESVSHLPARARQVADVAGAGDTIIAAFAAGLAVGLDARDAAALANRAAGIVVAKSGTAVAYPNEILNDSHEERFEAAEAKVLTVAEAQDRVADWHRAGKSVGFTNGCFDLLHPGHVSLIAQAKAACDRLIVGLNSDASIKRLKGSDRPVQDETARSNVLAALAHVDMVVVFGEDTPLSLIKALKPDVLIKGADYTKETVVGASEVESWGGRVVLAALVEGQSTSGTIARMAHGG